LQLTLLRHGIAHNRGLDGTDATRQLTDQGAIQAAAAIQGLAKLIGQPDVIFTSPLVRALQTGSLAGATFNLTPDTLESLAYGPPSAVMEDLAKLSKQNVLLVGHEPTLSQLAEILCTGSDPVEMLQLKTSGAICVETQINTAQAAHTGRLKWLATPVMLQGLSQT
jgi:phosphohistidine phosphatase